MQELKGLKYFYDDTIKECIEVICHKKDLQLSEAEKLSLFIDIVAALRNISALKSASNDFLLKNSPAYDYNYVEELRSKVI